MILGLSVSAFTTLHVAISPIAIAAGVMVVYGMIRGLPMPVLNHLFLATTVATTLSGFLFPISGLTPALMTGLVSSILLGAALFAYYRAHLNGRWRGVYVVTAVAALYLNCFVLVVQSFQKLGVLQPLAPTQSEPPFLAAQGTVLLTFVLLGYLAFKRGRAAFAAN